MPVGPCFRCEGAGTVLTPDARRAQARVAVGATTPAEVGPGATVTP